MKTTSLLCTFALASAVSVCGPLRLPADPVDLSVSLASGNGTLNPGVTVGDINETGTFRLSDGRTGTYLETHAFGNGLFTTTIVYTLADGSATSTDTSATTLGADQAETTVNTHRAFGATAVSTFTTTFASTSTTRTRPNGTTVTRTGPGSYGTGTFTAADGTTGTLTSFFTVVDGVVVTSTDYTGAAGLTRELRTQQADGNRLTITVASVDPAGALTTTMLTRVRGGHVHH